MKVSRLIPGPLPEDADATIGERVLVEEPRQLTNAHGVILRLPAIELVVTQVFTERGWRFHVVAQTPLAEGGGKYEARLQGTKIEDSEVMDIWCGIDGESFDPPEAVLGVLRYEA